MTKTHMYCRILKHHSELKNDLLHRESFLELQQHFLETTIFD